MKTLNTLELPLENTVLIEASAGTGKTFTMANLYLRLLLGIGCEPLTVEQILVVTFTKAATEELRDRIRKNTKACREFLRDYQENQPLVGNETFYLELKNQIKNLEEAQLRLQIAEREIDLASIFTIHSFCQKMLFQFAFQSGVRFDSDLKSDESDLLKQLSEQTWRELFYPMPLNEAKVVAAELKNPENALSCVRSLLTGELPEPDENQQWLMLNLDDYLKKYQQFIAQTKNHWQKNGAEIIGLIDTELNKKYGKGVKKSISRNSYKQNHFANWCEQVNCWANSDMPHFPVHFERFCQEKIRGSVEAGAEPLEHPLFAENQQFLTAYTQFAGKQKPLLLYHFLLTLRQKLADYKATHSEKSFNDMLTFLHYALHQPQGEALATQIRQQFPFAMIDEFQDTDKIQYEIFERIFMQGGCGFIMIGDPKQSIYKFRGADIFTYLKAATNVNEKRTLNKNWRSLPPVVEVVNRLFQFPDDAECSAFLYRGIQFEEVKAKSSEVVLSGNQPLVCYFQPEFDEVLATQHCAYQIQQQLKQMEAGEFGLKSATGEVIPFQAKDIAILVRTHKQAQWMKEALNKLGIRSVFLSEKRSVYQSPIATELLWVLHACLNPYQQSAVLTALGSALWGLSAQQIYQLKNDEATWDHQIEKFIGYQHIWQQQGVLPMLHNLFMQEGIIERLRQTPNADRHLTDLLHLSELLQQAMTNLENESALVRWYERQLKQPKDEQILRLESEDELVKIETIHGSKGLQYPIVWLPFAGKASSGATNHTFALYRDQLDTLRWQFGTADKATKALMDQTEFAEDLRLLYVAITRAESQLNLILPTHFKKGWNAVHYLLSNGKLGKSATKEYLDAKKIAYQAVELGKTVAKDDWCPPAILQENLTACHFEGHIRSKGIITSFTQLHALHEYRQEAHNLSDVARDDDRTTEVYAIGKDDESDSYSPYQFPHSTKVGTLLHRFFEQSDFQQAVDFVQISALCEGLSLGEEWHTPLTQWLENVLATPFGDEPFALNQIEPTKRLNEWQFYLRLANPQGLKKLNQLLTQYSELSQSLPPLQFSQLEGYVRGFVDCIVEVNGKFYVLDYKSNFLGYSPQDYAPKQLNKAMGQFRYDLQYLLYSLAVHRYLRSRLGERYSYEQNFGGVAYLFLRGMNGAPQSGVFFTKPCKALIEGMDEIFG